MNRRRIREWLAVIRLERGTDVRIPWLKMLRGILTPVPRAVWRERLRYGCYQCPIFDHETMRCRSVHPDLLGLGCGCYVVFTALVPEPYVGGCWGRAKFNDTFGWGAYAWPSRIDRWLALPRFLMRK